MAGSRADGLVRKPEQPPRVTFKQLFFDLVFVFAFTPITEQLIRDFTVHRRTFFTGAGETMLLLLALLMVWFVTAWITDLYNPERREVGLVITMAMVGLLMAVVLPQAFGRLGLAFAGAYVAIHIGRGLVFVPALRGHEAQRRAAGVLLWFAVSALPWLVGAIVSESSIRAALWTLAIAIDYTGALLLWPAPWTGDVRSRWPVAAEYLSERYRQFFIIALGELIFIAGTTYGGKYLGGGSGHTAALVVSIATTMLLWRIYTYRAGQLLPAAIAAAPDPGRLVRRALLAHLLMVIGIIVISAGYGLVIDDPLGRTDPVLVAVILGGPTLFVVGRTAFEHTVFARISRDWVIGLLVLVAITPVMRFVPPLAVATTAMAVLIGIAIADGAHSRRRPSPQTSGPA